MKRFAWLMCAFLVAGMMVAPVTALLAAGKTHDMTTQVVSVDLEKKTITFKDDKGENQTAPVMGKAAESFKTLKAGDKVVLTCTDNEKGEHQGISVIKLVVGYITRSGM